MTTLTTPPRIRIEPVRPKDRFLVFGAPTIEQPEIDEVVDSLRAGWLGTGPKVARFERAFADRAGTGSATAVSSCTAALHLSLLAAGVAPGDEVITTPLTFCATVNAILHAGAVPVLADVDPETMNLDPAALAAAVTPRTRAIVPVHFAGRPCDMDAIMAIARRHDLVVIEDCAHAIETELHGVRAGTIGDFGCFSFYATKNVVTGEGGMVLTRDAAAAARVRRLALHGLSDDAWKRFGDSGFKHYDVVELGFKCNMMDIQAAIGIHQLARVEQNWWRRRAVWSRYQDGLAGLPVILPAEPAPDTRHALHLYTLLIDETRAGVDRDTFCAAMTDARIGVGVHYRSVADHPFYREHLGWHPEAWPNAHRIGRQTISLPMSPGLTEQDVVDVLRAVRGILRCASGRAA